MIDTREAIQTVGEILANFLKSGERYPNHLEDTQVEISKLICSIIKTTQEATENYQQVCKDFIDEIIKIKGMPTRILGSGDCRSQNIISSRIHIAEKFDTLLPYIIEKFDFCIANYRSQAEVYLDCQVGHFQSLLREFFAQVPLGGTKDKLIKKQISTIKQELRRLAKWEQLFDTYKAQSFPAAVEYIFVLAGNPLAAIWHYSSLDEQGEYQKTYNHKQRDGRVYAVRGSWAIEKGLMKVGPDGYMDEISAPGQELGCMCSLQWVTGVRRLPNDMMTEKGCSELNRVRAVMQVQNRNGD